MRLLLLMPLLWLVACGNSSHVPVLDRYNSGSSGVGASRGVHVVGRGDTLYSIAWRHGKDFRQLAAANNIKPPYTIYPGQQIRLDGAVARPPAPPSRSSASKPSTRTPSAAPPARSPAPRPSVPASAGVIAWQWPADGSLLNRFVAGSVSAKGIVIAGGKGDPVRAAAAGVVVYRGSGLTGYGNLLIIKHDNRWLSAYAHNDTMLVAEGAKVGAGQRIASMGDSGTFRTQLHFEIRRDGNPVDPLTLLPKR
ncbi:MAG: peptidoglycan DD-metalloendopeptidase family protein [Alcanivoracaceae bacterium]|nr:peptidoglycan DD-metalloendopeptidase family protein [Alcanivoracaceae bacterium]